MAGSLSHDFNNLLLVILSNAELLERRSDEEQQPLLEDIRVAGEAAAELTSQLLAFAGQQVPDSDVVEVDASIRRVDGLLRRLVHPNVTLDVRLGADREVARGDPTQIEQALVNLVMNAQHAMPDGGTITVETTCIDVTDAEANRHAAALPGPHVRIAVTDTGIGMDAETKRHIFEPFYSRRDGGTGLGLATVHGTVTQNGGHIRVSSTPGRGTRFEVMLPRSSKASRAQEAAGGDARLEGGASVLLVDDQEHVLRSVASLLEARGFRVRQAASPEDALAASDEDPGRIDVVVTDVLMPTDSGPNLARRLLARRPDMKVLLMSGYTKDHLHSLSDLGDNVYFIAKPFTGAALAAKLAEILATDEKPTDR